jgi:uncharacterized protein
MTETGAPAPQDPQQPPDPRQQPPYGQPAPPPGWQQPPTGDPRYGQPPYSGSPYGGQQPGGGYPQYGPRPLTENDERTWALWSHLSPPVLALLSLGILPFLAPLVIWLVFRDRSRYVDDQAKEALNFQITLVIAYAIGWILFIALIGIVILGVAWVLSIIFGIQGAMAANRHELYRYPISIRFIR